MFCACNDSASSGPLPSANPYTTLTLNTHSAVISIVAPYDTLQLSAVARTASDAAVTSGGTVTYKASDTSVTVSPSGLVTAQFVTTPGQPSVVVAALRDSAQNITRVDSVFIVVTDQTPSSPLATFAIVQPSGDSAKVGVYDPQSGLWPDTVRITASAADLSDIAPVIASRFLSSDPATATVDPNTGVVIGIRPGRVAIRTEATYYGVHKSDSLRIQIGNPVVAMVTMFIDLSVPGHPKRYFVPSTITIGVGGTIKFLQWFDERAQNLPVDIVFDDSADVVASAIPLTGTAMETGNGNISNIPSPYIDPVLGFSCPVEGPPDNPLLPCNGASRAFPRAGTYHYHSVLYGTSGTIIVAAP